MEVVGVEHVADAAIEALDHAIGFRRPGLGQAVLDAQGPAQPVELVMATGLTLARGEQAIGELLAVVGQQLTILIGLAWCSACKKLWALAALLSLLIATNTQRVARSMATNR